MNRMSTKSSWSQRRTVATRLRSIFITKVIAAFDGWNAEVSQWKSELDRFELPGHAKMLLTSFGLFARVYINQGGLEDPVLVDNPRRWVYGTAAAQAAHDMLEIAQLEPFCSGLALFPPIYIQARCVSCFLSNAVFE